MKLAATLRTLVSAAGAVICLACTAPAATVLVSFSGTNAAVRPSSGVYYNSATVASAAQTAAGMVPLNGSTSPMRLADLTNASTGWTLTLTKTNTSGTVVAGKNITRWPFTYNPPAYPPAIISFPVNALQDNIDVSQGAVLLVTVSNLNPQLNYNLLAYGASASSQLNGLYSLVTGASSSPATVNFDSYANRTVTPTWTNITPSADGRIAFTITSPNSVVALNFMELADSGNWETLVDGGSFTNAQAFITQWYYNYPWGTIHNGSALMNPANVAVSNGVVTMTSSLANSYEGTSMSPWNIPIAYNSGTFFLQQEMVISPQSPVWDISGDFIVPTVYGTWPAMWLLGVNEWPPESDILEVKGSSVIWQNTYDGNWQTQLTDVPTAGSTWHNYRMLATMLDSTNVDFQYFIDGELTSDQQASTFVGVPCELIIDFQMGGAGGSPGPNHTTYTCARNIMVKREDLFGGSLGGGVVPGSNVPYQEDWGTTKGGTNVTAVAEVGWNQVLPPDFYSGFFQYANTDDATGSGLPANSLWIGDSDAGPNLAMFYTTNGAGSGSYGDSAFMSIDPTRYTNLEFSVYAQWGWKGGALQSWFAIQVAGAWFVSINHPIIPNQAGGGNYHRTDMLYSPAATNWNHLTVGSSVDIGAPASAALSGPITGIGLVVESTGGWWNLNELQVTSVAIVPTTLGSIRAGVGGGNSLTLNWTPSANVHLQNATSLAPPVVWTDVPDTTGQDSATIATTNTQMYFRLIQP